MGQWAKFTKWAGGTVARGAVGGERIKMPKRGGELGFSKN
jgi:hypothetical protein